MNFVTVSNEDLKPCPFCGGEDLHGQTYFDGQWHYIVCMTCCGRGGESMMREEAVAFWNKRAPALAESGR